MRNFKLKFNKSNLEEIAGRYEYQTDGVLSEISKSAKEKNYLTKDEFLKICAWKTPRSKPKCASNSNEYIEEVTRIAFTTKSDQLRIEILTLLNEVGWPTASTILHFCHNNEEFPILDFRALFSLSIEVPKRYDFSFWSDYTKYCRKLREELKLDLRIIDRGLWQYSKENQI